MKIMLSCGIEGDLRQHHDACLVVNEVCFPIVAAILAGVALRSLRGKS
jgi:hypothetical protein